MISLAEAQHSVLKETGKSRIEEVSIYHSLNRILREDILTDRPSPPFDRVAMDGIAVLLEEDFITSGEWKITGIIQAGQEGWKIKIGECFEIMTGAFLPVGVNTVIKIEDLTIEGDIARLRKGIVVKSRQNVHFRGSDMNEGERIIRQYSKITPGICALAASMGYNKVKVSKKPEIGIISTGNELTPIKDQPLPYQIRRSNDIMVAEILRVYAGEIKYYAVDDDFEATREVIKKCLSENDICITIGGISKGKFDFIPEILQDLGSEILVRGVQQKPGKPFIFAKHTTTFIFALPGNPSSAFVCAYVYILPFIMKQAGYKPSVRKARLCEEYKNESKMTRILEMKIISSGSNLLTKPIRTNGSGDMTGLIKADAICIFYPCTTYPKGTLMEIIKVN